MFRKRMKLSVIFTMISSIFISVSGLVGLIYFAFIGNFASYYDLIVSTIASVLPLEIDFSQLSGTIYIIYIVQGVFATLLPIPGLIFAILNRNEANLSIDEFQGNNKKHVLFLVFLGVAYLAASYETGSLLADSTEPLIGSLGSILLLGIAASEVLLVISFFFALFEVRNNRRIYVYHKTVKEKEETHQNDTYEEPIDVTDNKEETATNQIDEEEIKRRQEKLDEMYALLAKLEKSYKANEISEEDYQRMKKTIIENYMK